mmetsp:Transcript_35576/g.83136  ORF Transcript_35576/g.83136 Transcript_35576/m.83136 type:complete len:205 (+) Transcript_35576:547-1161(+)
MARACPWCVEELVAPSGGFFSFWEVKAVVTETAHGDATSADDPTHRLSALLTAAPYCHICQCHQVGQMHHSTCQRAQLQMPRQLKQHPGDAACLHFLAGSQPQRSARRELGPLPGQLVPDMARGRAGRGKLSSLMEQAAPQQEPTAAAPQPRRWPAAAVQGRIAMPQLVMVAAKAAEMPLAGSATCAATPAKMRYPSLMRAEFV